jgi:hypothetical protein
MKFLLLLSLMLLSVPTFARSYVIFSMSQELNMGFDDEVSKKNYYINMGTGQGLKKDSIVDVFRIITIQNPYDNQQRVNYKVKVGELKVIHASDNASIAMVSKYESTEDTPIFDIPRFMIGDHIAINVD